MTAAHRGSIESAPFQIFNIELTNRCPFKCVMCARTNNMTRAEGIMSRETFRKIIDEVVRETPEHARSPGIWMHHFGESLVHPEFDVLMRHAAERGVTTRLSINPLMLKADIATRLLSARPGTLYLSLDGHDDASFERIRGVADAYEVSKERLLAFLALKAGISPATRIVLSMIHFDDNIESIDKTRAYWESVPGIDTFFDKPFTTWDGNAADVLALLEGPHRRSTGPIVCTWPWRSMTIAWDGDVVPCCHDYDKRYVLGNIHESSLTEIWNGAPMQALRAEFLSGDVSNPLCRNCEALRGR